MSKNPGVPASPPQTTRLAPSKTMLGAAVAHDNMDFCGFPHLLIWAEFNGVMNSYECENTTNGTIVVAVYRPNAVLVTCSLGRRFRRDPAGDP